MYETIIFDINKNPINNDLILYNNLQNNVQNNVQNNFENNLENNLEITIMVLFIINLKKILLLT